MSRSVSDFAHPWTPIHWPIAATDDRAWSVVETTARPSKSKEFVQGGSNRLVSGDDRRGLSRKVISLQSRFPTGALTPGQPIERIMRTLLASVVLLLIASAAQGGTDALDEVNAVRAGRGLPAFQRDEALSIAASKAADFRAARNIAGHTSSDFAFVPQGASAGAAGCAAWTPGFGWGSCCTYERWRYAGAAWAMGRDGRRYMHLYVR